jgi:hypothetical protein
MNFIAGVLLCFMSVEVCIVWYLGISCQPGCAGMQTTPQVHYLASSAAKRAVADSISYPVMSAYMPLPSARTFRLCRPQLPFRLAVVIFVSTLHSALLTTLPCYHIRFQKHNALPHQTRPLYSTPISHTFGHIGHVLGDECNT